jgi:hypothetical protein
VRKGAKAAPSCAICDVRFNAAPCDRRCASGCLVRQPLAGVALCSHCYGRHVTIRTAREERLGARTFYVVSLTDTSKVPPQYTVKLFGQRLVRSSCDCPDYTHRGQVLGVPCKHVRIVRLLCRAAGGASRVGKGITVRFRLADPATTKGGGRG